MHWLIGMSDWPTAGQNPSNKSDALWHHTAGTDVVFVVVGVVVVATVAPLHSHFNPTRTQTIIIIVIAIIIITIMLQPSRARKLFL